MPTESMTQKWAKKARKPNPSGAGSSRDKKLNEAEKKSSGSTPTKTSKRK